MSLTVAHEREHAEVLDRARSLLPTLRERAADAEENRLVPEQTITELREAGLLDIAKPRRYGGAELGVTAMLRVSRELATGCLSTAWLQSVFSSHLFFLAQFPLEAQERVYEDPDALVSAVLRLTKATVRRVDGGFALVGGEGRFCSGVDYCTWLLLGAEVDGAERRFFLVPRAEVEIVDDWHTSGMRATGSKSIRVADSYIRAEHSVVFASMLDGSSPGATALETPFFRHGVDYAPLFSLLGNPLGGAAAATASFLRSAAGRYGAASDADRAGQSAPLSRLAAGAAALDAAYALVLADAQRLDRALDGVPISALEKARVHRNRAYAAQTARRVVNDLYELSGGSVLYDGAPLQRWWRDVNGACGHIGFSWTTAMGGFGRAAVEAELAQ